MLLRIQDKDGRGPFRPGITHQWLEFNHRFPSIMDDFGEDGLKKAMAPFHERGMQLGCAVRGWKKLKKWFSPTELQKLESLGYSVVKVRDYKVVLESKHQVIFATILPLRYMPVAQIKHETP